MKRILFIAIAFLFCGLSTAEAQTRSDGFCKVTVVNPSGPMGCCYSNGRVDGFFEWENGHKSSDYGYYNRNDLSVELRPEVGSGNLIYQKICIHPVYDKFNGLDGSNYVEYDHAEEEVDISPKSCCKPAGPIQPPGPPSTY